MNIDADALADAVRTVLPVTRSGPMPVLKGVRLEPDGDRQRFTATDIDMTISTAVEVDGASVDAIVPAALLAAWAEGAEGQVTLGPDDNDLVLTSDTGVLRLRTLPLDDWPRCETAGAPPVALDASTRALLAAILYAASRDQARPILNGVGIGDGWACCTDSYQLSAVRVEGLADAIVPVRLFELALKAEGETTIAVDERRVTVTNGATAYTARLIEGRFPSWQGLVGVPTTTVTLDRDRTAAALERVLILTEAETPVRVTPDSAGLTFTVVSRDVGEVVERVDGGTELSATYGFRPRLLLNMLRAREEAKVELGVIDSLHPVSVRDENSVALVMPVRI